MSTKYSSILARFNTPIDETCGARKRLAGCESVAGVYHIPVDRISPDPEQPRKEFDDFELRSLADSLRSRGQLQPARVRYVSEEDRFVIITGERRWRAAKLAGLATLTAIIDDEDHARLETQLIENLVRSGLSPIEEAKAFRTLIDKHGWTAKSLSERVGVSESKVSRSLALLELPAPVQEQVDAGELKGAAIRERITKPERKTRSKTARRSKKEEVFTTAGGVRVVVRLKKAGDFDAVEPALLEALERVRERKNKAAAA